MELTPIYSNTNALTLDTAIDFTFSLCLNSAVYVASHREKTTI